MYYLKWFVHRLLAMSMDEVVFRLKAHLRNTYLKKKISRNKLNHSVPPLVKFPERKPLNINIRQGVGDVNALLNEADLYLDGKWLFFGLENVSENTINWHRDPVSNKFAPLRFGFDINHRDETIVGNIKNIWEKNRHHHLTVLAVAYNITGNEKYAHEVVVQLQSWIEQNSFMIGVNWTHPLEHGIRLISWVWCERLLRGSKYYDKIFSTDTKFWDSLYQHQWFIDKYYSRGSSANNHLIGEMAGLFIASSALPVFNESENWRKKSKEILEREIEKQTFESGVNKELAFSYHIFSAEFLILAYYEGINSNDPFSDRYKRILKGMIEIIPVLTDYGRNLPRYGDGDEGMAVQLQPIDSRRDNWLYEAGKNLLDCNVPINEIRLLPSQILGIGNIKKDDYTFPEQAIGFHDAGLFILSHKRNTPEEIFVLADAGPLGYLSLAAHGHADALAFTLHVAGMPFLIDPGTYCYHTERTWREYFRGTNAHNTISIDNEDQSKQIGHFLWGRKAKTDIQEFVINDFGGKLTASHDGYKKKGITHTRTIELQKNTIVVKDFVSGSDEHLVYLNYHLHPDCIVEMVNEINILVKRKDITVNMSLPKSMIIKIINGGTDAGWYSPKFGIKEKTNTVRGIYNGKLPISFETRFDITINPTHSSKRRYSK